MTAFEERHLVNVEVRAAARPVAVLDCVRTRTCREGA